MIFKINAKKIKTVIFNQKIDLNNYGFEEKKKAEMLYR